MLGVERFLVWLEWLESGGREKELFCLVFSRVFVVFLGGYLLKCFFVGH